MPGAGCARDGSKSDGCEVRADEDAGGLMN